MLPSVVRANRKETDAYRGDAPWDTLHLHLFKAASVTITPGSWRATDVCSPYWRFYRNETGGAALLLYGADGDKYPFPLVAGESFLVPAGVRFDCRCTASAIEHFYVHFEVVGLPVLLLRALFNHPITLNRGQSASEQVAAIADQIKVCSEDAADRIPLLCRTKAMIYDAIAASLTEIPAVERERYEKRADGLTPFLAALDRIERNLAEPLTNRSLADACFLSEDYFIRRFKECVGESPARYVQRRRMEGAAIRLLFSADSIEAIASAHGFGNRFHFTRVFTGWFGVPPATYRKAGKV